MINSSCFRIVLSVLISFLILLSGCSSKPKKALDGAPKSVPRNLLKTPDAVPRVEPIGKGGNRFKNSNSYVAKKKRYHVLPTSKGYRAQGLASWYGTYFHGRKTSSGEKYNMFAMTAAHRTLPLPTYAKVTNLDNGKSVIVKINDRGPFHGNRLLDVSYVAAAKLGMLGKGTGRVEIVSIDPRDHGGAVPKLRSRRPLMIARNKPQNQKQIPPLQKPPLNIANSRNPNLPIHPQPIRPPAIHPQPSNQKQTVYLQLGTYQHREAAIALAKKIEKISKCQSQITQKGGQKSPVFQVRLGPIDDQEAINLTHKLARARLPVPEVVKGK